MKLLKFDEIQFHPIKNHLKHLKITVSGKQNQQRFFISFFPFQIHQFFLQIHKQIRNQFIAIDVVVGYQIRELRDIAIEIDRSNYLTITMCTIKASAYFFPRICVI